MNKIVKISVLSCFILGNSSGFGASFNYNRAIIPVAITGVWLAASACHLGDQLPTSPIADDCHAVLAKYGLKDLMSPSQFKILDPSQLELLAKFKIMKSNWGSLSAGPWRFMLTEKQLKPVYHAFILHEAGHLVERHSELNIAVQMLSAICLLRLTHRVPLIRRALTVAPSWFALNQACGYAIEYRADSFAINCLLKYPSVENYQVLRDAANFFRNHHEDLKLNGDIDSSRWGQVKWFLQDRHPMPNDRAARFEEAVDVMSKRLGLDTTQKA
jgi:hypothetical protein